MDITLPSRDELKAQAKRLRTTLTSRGQTLTHSAALEAVAHQWGVRDWNTLSALADSAPALQLAPGQLISGRYLGHRFKGTVKSATALALGYWQLTLRFDQPIDVVKSDQFSAIRRQIKARINAEGRSVEKTSDGIPHLVIDV